MSNATPATTTYCVFRAQPIVDQVDDAPTQNLRTARGSRPPPTQPPPGVVRAQRLGEHRLEVQRDGSFVMIALPGALRLRGRPDQIRALAAALLAALDD